MPFRSRVKLNTSMVVEEVNVTNTGHCHKGEGCLFPITDIDGGHHSVCLGST